MDKEENGAALQTLPALPEKMLYGAPYPVP